MYLCLAALLAVGTCALLALLCRTAERFLSPAAALLAALGWAAVFSAAAWGLRGQFPPDGWQEYFSNDREPLPVRRACVWLAMGLMAGLELAVLLVIGPPGAPAQAAVQAAVCLALYWGGVYTVCLMVACRRERLTTLVEQDYRTEMQSFMSVIRSQRHDYNFHVQALAGLINKGDMDECRLYILKRGENCIIHVANQILSPEQAGPRLQSICRPGFSTKPDHEGIGLNTVQNLLRRYRGVLYFRLENDQIHFVAKIPLTLQGETL